MRGNTKVYLKDIGWGFVDWLHLTQDRVQWQVRMTIAMSLHPRKSQRIS